MGKIIILQETNIEQLLRYKRNAITPSKVWIFSKFLDVLLFTLCDLNNLTTHVNIKHERPVI